MCRVMKELPHYAAPLFVRLSREIEITNTFKYKKVNLVKDGFDPKLVKVTHTLILFLSYSSFINC
jgi:fatty-acyl-CoA synthase